LSDYQQGAAGRGAGRESDGTTAKLWGLGGILVDPTNHGDVIAARGEPVWLRAWGDTPMSPSSRAVEDTG